MKLVVVDHVHLNNGHIQRLRQMGELQVFSDPPKSDEELMERMRGAEIVIVGWSNITEQMLESLPNLRMIAIWATTCHYVDLEAAKKRGIVVTHVPGYGTEAVAEHAFVLLLASVRKLLSADRLVREGMFDWRPLRGSELAGKTIGIVGTGAIGFRVGEIARAFRMRILGYDILPNPKSAQDIGMEYVDFQTLLKESDVISLHVTLNTSSEHLFGKKEFEMMKDGAVLINTSQGKVVDEKALVDALTSGKLSCAGLDVFSEEPPSQDNPLFKLYNIVLTPHVGFHTSEAVERCSDICIDNVAKFLEGTPRNICASV
jgi:phosphoglycerate dehydrogenase-like enzyme